MPYDGVITQCPTCYEQFFVPFTEKARRENAADDREEQIPLSIEYGEGMAVTSGDEGDGRNASVTNITKDTFAGGDYI